MKTLAFFVCFCLCFSPFKVFAVDEEKPVDFTADELTYDREMNLIIARGNVVFKQAGSSLHADHINYDTIDDVVIATGNVKIFTPDGGLVQANYAKLQGDLKDGLIKNILYTLSDKSILTASKAEHIQGNFTEFQEVAYSSCDYCKDGSRFWEIRTQKMTHDKAKKKMSAHNATMMVGDLPVFYLPYFSYPDPTVKRSTGFLFPTIKSNKAMGAGLVVPFYLEINPYTDITISPWVATEGILWAGEFRRNFSEGIFDLSGTYVEQEGKSRYNFVSQGKWDINEVWRASFDVDHVSDKTYLRRYDVDSADSNASWLKSDVKVEALTSDAFFSLGAVKYENMRSDVMDSTVPEVLPLMRYAYETDPSKNGGYWNFDISSASLKRDEGDDSSRLTFGTGWTLPGVTSWGAMYSVNANAYVSGYDVSDYYIEEKNRLYSGTVASFNPQASLKVSYPFIRVGEKYNQMLEPIVMGVVAPNSEISDKIPNEDSSDLDFDDTSLFSQRRFIGFDRYETGSRMDYGLQWSMYGKEKGYISALVGQSYRFSDSQYFPPDSGLEYQTSDIVGRLSVEPNRFISLNYAFRLGRSSFELNESDVSLGVGNDILRVNASYINLKSTVSEYSDYGNREELLYSLESKLTRYWLIKFNQRLNLSENGGTIEVGGSLRYEDECFAIETGIEKDYTADQDYEGGVTFRLGIEFKPFGGMNM